MKLEELRAYVASNEYGAELALQHSMRLLEELERELAAKDAHADEIYNAAVDLAAKLEGDLEKERALADRLAGCMAHLAAYDWFIDGTHSHSVVCSLGPNRVREALTEWKQARGKEA